MPIKTYIVTMKGDLTFEVSVDDDGKFTVEGGWFDCRSAEDLMTAKMVLAPEGIDITDTDMFETLINATPGKGEILVR